MEKAQIQTENRNAWVFGFTPQAEIWNGRLAMIGFLAAILTEAFSNELLIYINSSFCWKAMGFLACCLSFAEGFPVKVCLAE
jgi:hypothetical protein